MAIILANKHYSKTEGLVIYCGRPSILENPFIIGKNGTRDEVCDRYEEYFKEQIILDGPFVQELRRIYRLAKTQDVTLMCFCTPHRCHCDTIKAFLDKHLKAT